MTGDPTSTAGVGGGGGTPPAERVSLQQLVRKLREEDRDVGGCFTARLDGEHQVQVEAVLRLTAVYTSSPDDTTHLACLDRLDVDPNQVPVVVNRIAAARRRGRIRAAESRSRDEGPKGGRRRDPYLGP